MNTRVYMVRKYAHDVPAMVLDDDEAQMYIDAGWFVDESVLNDYTPIWVKVLYYMAAIGGVIATAMWLYAKYQGLWLQ